MRPIARTLVIALALAGPLAALSVATAQNLDVIKQRQAVMKQNGKSAKAANALIKGETPYDAAAALQILQTLNADTKKFVTLFPEDSKTGGKTEASPAIWEKPAEWKAANDKMIADTQAAIDAKPADVAAFKTAFATVAANCGGCHKQVRVD